MTVIQRDGEETNQDCALVFFKKASSCDVTTPYSRSVVLLFLADTAAGFVLLVSVNHAVREVQRVAWLIWLLSCVALRLQKSHGG